MAGHEALDEARLRELAEAARKHLAGHDIKADGYGSQVWGQGLKGGDAHIADIRGWGYLTGRGGGLALSEEDGIAAQRAVQEYLCAAWNAVPHLLAALSAERERGDRAVRACEIIMGGKPYADLVPSLTDYQRGHDNCRAWAFGVAASGLATQKAEGA